VLNLPQPPDFFGNKTHDYTDRTRVKLPNAKEQVAKFPSTKEQAAETRQGLEEDKLADAQLWIKCGVSGKVEDEHMFFRKEMEITGLLSARHICVTY